MEYSFLHSSTVDLSGQDPKGPVARLGPLGWTCIGSPNGSKEFCHKRASFLSTFFMRPNVFDEINASLKKFWEVENSGVNVNKQEILTPDEKKALSQVQNSLKFVDGRYQLEVPWKNERPVLPDNYTMALKRLENTELKLLKHPEMAQDYQATITSYVQQGYIRKLPDDEMKQVPGWLLPHFPVFRPERQTTKTRIVFDASAKHKEVSLNDEILPGPKLQNDLVNILLRFRRNPIALVADISQMYLRIQIAPPDRRYFRFLWRDLDIKRTRKFMSSNESSLAKSLHHLKPSTQFKSMPENTRNNFQLQQKQSLNPPTWMIRWIPPSMSRTLLTCIINYHSFGRRPVCTLENGSAILPTS